MIRPHILQACREAGAIDVYRVASSVSLAASKGELMEALASLRHWQPELFEQPLRPKYEFRENAPRKRAT